AWVSACRFRAASSRPTAGGSGRKTGRRAGASSTSRCPSSTAREASMPGRGEIHIVDDDDAIRDSLAFLLDASGWRTRAWPSAESFLADVELSKVACLITDVRMPGLSGLD